MNEQEQAIADAVYAAMMEANTTTERAEQDREFKIGASSLGHCSELTRRMLAGIEPEGEQDWMAAILGTAMGDWIEHNAIPRVWPDAILQAEVITPLVSGERTYQVPGHPDVILPAEGLVLDNKGTGTIEIVRRNGPKQQQQFQRHIYAKGAWLAGMFPDHKLEDIRVGNIWHDRTAKEKGLHVQIEPYSEDVISEATEWLDEVVYAYLQGEEARKEPHYGFCEGYCPHFNDCRLGETDVEGLIVEEDAKVAVSLVLEARELEARAKRLKNQAQIALNGIQGSTGDYTVRWVHVNGSNVSFTRDPYMKLDIRPVKKPKVKK